ncbi:MAG TPA: cytochrome c oxidase assembly protein [Gemmatimonadales bacterium]|nr:cytochrome c oxidase assembly protein [Gemmatimonadales bacterium]
MSFTASLLLHGRAVAGPFTWAWSIHPSVVIGTGLLGAVYCWGIGPWRRRRGLPPARPGQITAFGVAMLLLLGSLNGPVHDLSDDYLFWVHMVQHMVLTLIWPPLLIYSIPGWLLEPALAVPGVRRVARVLTQPVVAALIFTVTFAAWHVQQYYELMMEVHGVHVATHILFMVASVILWFPVLSPLAEFPRLAPGKAMLYLFLSSIPMQIVAAILTFADTPLYPWYVAAPRVPQLGNLSALEDLTVGGLIMWIPGNLYMFGAIALQFRRWVRENQQEEELEAAARQAAREGAAVARA